MPRIVAHLDCFWLGSAYEGQSNALMEAMSLGIPSVVTDIPGNRDLVEQGVHGYVVPVGDRAGFSRWTNVLLDDRALARRMGDAAQQRMLNEFSVEKMVSRHADLYRSLTSEGHATRASA